VDWNKAMMEETQDQIRNVRVWAWPCSYPCLPGAACTRDPAQHLLAELFMHHITSKHLPLNCATFFSDMTVFPLPSSAFSVHFDSA